MFSEYQNVIAYLEREDCELTNDQQRELHENGTIDGMNYLDWMDQMFGE